MSSVDYKKYFLFVAIFVLRLVQQISAVLLLQFKELGRVQYMFLLNIGTMERNTSYYKVYCIML
jgi:hypothetical protein